MYIVGGHRPVVDSQMVPIRRHPIPLHPRLDLYINRPPTADRHKVAVQRNGVITQRCPKSLLFTVGLTDRTW